MSFYRISHDNTGICDCPKAECKRWFYLYIDLSPFHGIRFRLSLN